MREISVLLVIIIIVGMGIGFATIFHNQDNIASEGTMSVKGTGSMLPLIYPDNELVTEPFDGELKCGHLYVYVDELNKSKLIVHRFVYEDKDGKLYFKGDNNNLMDDPIYINQIKKKVVGIDYG